MANSLRAKLKKLNYEGKITDEELTELLEKLDGHDQHIYNSFANAQREKLLKVFRQIPLNQFARFLKIQVARPCEICTEWQHCVKGGEVSCINGIGKFILIALTESEADKC